MADQPAIRIEDLWFSYDGPPVLAEVSLELDCGEFACIVGPNGGGKTTLLKLILGLLQPDRGTVRVFGGSPVHAGRRIGYTPQHAVFDAQFPASVMDVALMGRLGRSRLFGPYGKADRQAAGRALAEVDVYDLRKRSFSALSGGQRQRVLIARSLASDPELLLFDEPTVHLDVRVEKEFYELLRELNKRLTVVVVSHDVGLVSQFISTVVCVKQRVSLHPTAELHAGLIRDLYGQDIRMVRHDHKCSQGRSQHPNHT